MSTVRCSSCGDSFRVPDVVAPDAAMVECPWCGQQLAFAELQRFLPPLAQWLGADGQPIVIGCGPSDERLSDPPAPLPSAPLLAKQHSTAAGDDDLAFLQDDEPPVAIDCESTDAFPDEPMVLIEDQATDAIDDESLLMVEDEAAESWEQQSPHYGDEFEHAVQPRPLSEVSETIDQTATVEIDAPAPFVARPIRPRKQASPLRSIVWIVLGGLMAFPLAGGILALAGKPLNLGIWPFDGETFATSSMRQQLQRERDEATRMANHASSMQYSRSDDSPTPAGNSSDQWHQSLEDPDEPLQGVADAAVGTAPETTAGAMPDRTTDTSLAAAETLPPSLQSPVAEPVTAPNVAQTSPLSPLDAQLPNTLPDMEDPFAAPSSIAPSDLPTPPEEQLVMPTESLPPAAAPSLPEPDWLPPADTEPQIAASQADSMPTVLDNPPPAAAIELPTVPLDLQAEPVVSAALATPLAAAQQALAGVGPRGQEAAASDYREKMATLFAAVAALGLSATPADAVVIDDFMDQLRDRGLLNIFTASASSWIRLATRRNDGMLAMGVLRQTESQWRLEWSGPEPLVVQFADGIVPEADASVVLLGRILPREEATVGTLPPVEVTYWQHQ